MTYYFTSESHQFKTRNFIDYTPEIISRVLDEMLASFLLAGHKLVIWKEGASKHAPPPHTPDWLWGIFLTDDQQGRATLWVMPPVGLVVLGALRTWARQAKRAILLGALHRFLPPASCLE